MISNSENISFSQGIFSAQRIKTTTKCVKVEGRGISLVGDAADEFYGYFVSGNFFVRKSRYEGEIFSTRSWEDFLLFKPLHRIDNDTELREEVENEEKKITVSNGSLWLGAFNDFGKRKYASVYVGVVEAFGVKAVVSFYRYAFSTSYTDSLTEKTEYGGGVTYKSLEGVSREAFEGKRNEYRSEKLPLIEGLVDFSDLSEVHQNFLLGKLDAVFLGDELLGFVNVDEDFYREQLEDEVSNENILLHSFTPLASVQEDLNGGVALAKSEAEAKLQTKEVKKTELQSQLQSLKSELGLVKKWMREVASEGKGFSLPSEIFSLYNEAERLVKFLIPSSLETEKYDEGMETSKQASEIFEDLRVRASKANAQLELAEAEKKREEEEKAHALTIQEDEQEEIRATLLENRDEHFIPEDDPDRINMLVLGIRGVEDENGGRNGWPLPPWWAVIAVAVAVGALVIAGNSLSSK